MPILDVELYEPASPGLAQHLADAVGQALASPTCHTWVRLHPMDPRHYAENGASVAPADLPVFVTILHREPPVGTALESEVKALTALVAAVLGKNAERVHLRYAVAAAGRQAFGGKLV
ncbi:MAG: hypothetical protein JO006_17670 [Paucibacter sp.]|nr:hypothetical protein [Roseateles sp.]